MSGKYPPKRESYMEEITKSKVIAQKNTFREHNTQEESHGQMFNETNGRKAIVYTIFFLSQD